VFARLSVLVLFAVLAAMPGSAAAVVTPVRESAPRFEDDDGADADDPGIWVNPLLSGRSVVVGTLKDAGLTVFDLEGRTLQDVSAPPAPGPEDAPGRFNNVDVIYGARVGHAVRDLPSCPIADATRYAATPSTLWRRRSGERRCATSPRRSRPSSSTRRRRGQRAVHLIRARGVGGRPHAPRVRGHLAPLPNRAGAAQAGAGAGRAGGL
jgi:hypothetical protein